MRVGADGATEGQHEDSAARQWAMLGRKPRRTVATTAEPQCPPAFVYLWEQFWDLVSGVPANGMVPPAPGWGDLYHWRALTGAPIQTWEARVLIMLGALRAQVLSEEKPKGSS